MPLMFPVVVLSFVAGWALKTYFFPKSNDGWRVFTKEDPLLKKTSKVIIVDPSCGIEVDKGQEFLNSNIEKSNLVYFQTKNQNTGIIGWGKPSHTDPDKFIFSTNLIVVENPNDTKALIASMVSSASQLRGTKVNDLEIRQVVLRVTAIKTDENFYLDLGFKINEKKSSESKSIILEKEIN